MHRKSFVLRHNHIWVDRPLVACRFTDCIMSVEKPSMSGQKVRRDQMLRMGHSHSFTQYGWRCTCHKTIQSSNNNGLENQWNVPKMQQKCGDAVCSLYSSKAFHQICNMQTSSVRQDKTQYLQERNPARHFGFQQHGVTTIHSFLSTVSSDYKQM